MIKRIQERDIFIDEVINPTNNKKVILVATEEYVHTRFGIPYTEGDIDIGTIEIDKATGLFNEIKNSLQSKTNINGYIEISPRLDAVLMAETEEGKLALINFIRSEIDITSN